MRKKRSFRACVAGWFSVCAVFGTHSMAAQADTVVITVPVESSWGVAINPAGTFAYVTQNDSSNGKVVKIDLATDTVVATITAGSSPSGVAINPAGTFAYVTNVLSNTVSKIDLATDTVVTTIPVGKVPGRLAINPAGTFAYVANGYSLSVSKINLATDTVVATIELGTQPTDVAINPAGTFIYVTNFFGTVSKINSVTDTVVTTIPVEKNSYGVAINPAGTFAYVTGDKTVSKINLATDTVVTTIALGKSARSLAINPAGTFAYVTGDKTVSKIALTSDTVGTTITVGSSSIGLAINPAGTFVYVTNNTVSKINSTTEPQSTTFTAISDQLLGVKTAALTATASSALAVVFSSATTTVCTVSGSTVTMLTTGSCTVNANQAGGSGWNAAPQVSRTFAILPSPPAGEPGVSIKNGDSYVNTKQVTLNLVWPEYATAVRVSNDGGFAASKTQTKDLAASIDWELDDSVKGLYTKVVYVRFNGVTDTTKTYSDDVILDTTAPVIETASASRVSGVIGVTLKASDDITGVDKVEIKNGASIVAKDYDKKLSVTETEIGLSVSSSGVKKFAGSSIEIRVSDKAGNWSGYQTLSVPGAVITPVVTTKKAASAKSIATFAKLKVLSTSKVSLKVASSYAKYCKVLGATLRGVKTGTCKVTVTIIPKKGRATSKTLSLKVTK
jgi:YVTN family beta-propeller protein